MKSTPMSILKAAKGTNPNYTKGIEYQMNCQRCVHAYELRRRRYVVCTKPIPASGNSISWGSECFTPPGKNARGEFTFHLTEKEVKNRIASSPNGARFVVYIEWKNQKTTHVFVAERNGGVIRFIAPQDGNENAAHYFSQGTEGEFGVF